MRVARDVRTHTQLIDLAVADHYGDDHAQPNANGVALADADRVAIAYAEPIPFADCRSDAAARDTITRTHGSGTCSVLRGRRCPHAGA